MANLTRWSKPIAPKWLGNDQDPTPFTMRYRRLSVDERRDFRDRMQEIVKQPGAGAKELAEVFAVGVEGPLRDPSVPAGSPPLVIDGKAIEEKDLTALLEVAITEPITLEGRLIDELAETLLVVVNGTPERTAGESAGSRGGGSSTRADPAAEAPAPTAAA